MRSDMRERRDRVARKLLHSGEGLVWREAVALADEVVKCGARTMAGTPCRRKALANGKCIKHGGGTPPRTPDQREAQRKFVATQPRHRGRFVKLEAAE
jgi:hypothetical protein